MQPRRFGRLWSLAACLAFLSLSGPARGAIDVVTIENVRVGFGDKYKVGSWTPVFVDLKANPSGHEGYIELVVSDDDGTPTRVGREYKAGPSELLTVTLYTKPGSRSAEFNVTVYDTVKRRRAIASKVESPTETLEPGQGLIVTAGQTRGVEELASVPGLNSDATVKDNQFVVAAARLPDGLPGLWYGFDGVEVIVIDTNSPEALDALNSRIEAIKTWVSRGGHLVLAIGSDQQKVMDNESLRDLLPALPSGQTRLNDLGALEAFANSNSPITSVGSKAVTVTKLTPVEARGGRGLDATAPSPLVVRGHYHFGRVTVVGLDVDKKPFSEWKDKQLFWLKALDLHRRGGEISVGGVVVNRGGGRIFRTDASDLATVLHSRLEQFPGVRLVPFGYVAFFVFLYILLIGPGDYLFLKKVLKRMELTWITFPTIVASVSLLAYVAAYTIKGTELRLNKLDIVDIDQQSNMVRGSTFFTLFSPQNRDYGLELSPLPLDRDPNVGTSPAAQTTKASADSMMTWFGAPEGSFSMGSPSRMSLSSAPYSYEPMGSPRSLQGVRVPIWTTKSFTGRWFGVVRPALGSDLTLDAAARLDGTLTNQLERPMKNACLLYGKDLYKVGDLAPGQSKSLAGVTSLVLANSLETMRKSFPNQQAWNTETRMSNVKMPEIAWSMMFNESAGAGGSAFSSNLLRYLDLTGQLALDRPIFVAEIDGPATAVDLGQTSSAAKIDQITLLRVILSAKGSEADGATDKPANAETPEAKSDKPK